jgi:arabinan endo-1,5-alpha-L-arabinosidase
MQDGDNWYLVHHVRPEYQARWSTLHVRKIVWTPDGWPVCSPECFAGEEVQPVTSEQLVGSWERVKFYAMSPQPIISSVPQQMRPDGTATASSLIGSWKMLNDTTVEFIQGGDTETLRVLPAWDFERWCPTLVMTGKDTKGIAVWYKRVGDLPERRS